VLFHYPCVLIFTINSVSVKVAEKESLCGDRDMLILQLTKATTESGFLRETIASLKQDVVDAGLSVKRAGIDLKIEEEAAQCREQKLKMEIEEQKKANTVATADLTKVGADLMQSFKANSGLSDHIHTLESVLLKERAGREKERAALGASLNAIDDLTSKVKFLKIKDAEREVALEKISSLERDTESLRYEQFTLQEEMMATRAELEESDEQKVRLGMKIETLLAQKEEYESGMELLYLRGQVNELRDLIVSSEKQAEESESIFAVRLASSQKEIERLALDLLESQNEILRRDEARAEVEHELKCLQERVMAEDEERAKGDAVALVVAQSAEVKLTISELVLSLQHNRQLTGEIEEYKEKLEEEKAKSVSIQESALHSITLKAQQVEAVIDSSKATLYRAAGQVEEMKSQLLTAEAERSDLLAQLDDSEARTETVRTALHSAMIELEKKEREQQGLEFEIQRLVREKEEAAQHALRQAAMAAAAGEYFSFFTE
jgi:chromosome segregation ATPase